MGTTPERELARRLNSLPGAVPVLFSPGLLHPAQRLGGYLEAGERHLPELLGTEAPGLRAMLLSRGDWSAAPRENARPYPFGLPYFTRSVEPPTLVFPERLAQALAPEAPLTLPLTVWHEQAHAFFLRDETPKTPLWLGELVPQTASAAVARREGLPLGEHLASIEPARFTVREFGLPASAEDQMSFQNLLLGLGATMLGEFGEGFLGRLVGLLRREPEPVDGRRAERLLAEALGEGGREWLEAREEF
ncbi:Hypothetical Protein RradSPS_0214 [Rubrobacter radiotolerans]|uniref:Peptidase MA superfamily n=2 Tax=Rubrobacter radiotolerans TaxID=42256 RepID=A0A023WZ47_RUBRA|nr:hypothetical protein [Rubrobacter radiotolerans]AHY45497.1 Hypothetical Protein RradSPS_0214 [Rubrobacter radiotolerans]MDX5892908.1 hypothetical protein [Rubrobacter radiotolerans]SMC02726.1 hypothetical protein SAMN00767673_0216 [Rubrobacter radiotolerans DSM 5868]